ncbi:hypothetical protein HanIR_Chr05g0251831 [Helianthus annuus]|nr:hypothetical protein HanIR_Chr05g0251831 [Helianthus annuus]
MSLHYRMSRMLLIYYKVSTSIISYNISRQEILQKHIYDTNSKRESFLITIDQGQQNQYI